jgi:fatty acid synthase
MDVTGDFEITESGGLVASGKVSVAADAVVPPVVQPVWSSSSADDFDCDLTLDDIYKELRLRGYDYGETFRGILKADCKGK